MKAYILRDDTKHVATAAPAVLPEPALSEQNESKGRSPAAQSTTGFLIVFSQE